MLLSRLRLRLQHNKTSVRTAVRRNHKRSVQGNTAARRQKMSRGERTRSHAVILLLCTALVLSGATNAENINLSTCALQCEVLPGKTETKCTLPADPLKLNCSREDYSNILRNVSSLDLSDNKLTQVPTWMFPYCTSLTELSLAQNNIKTIKPGTFSDLRNLTILNLSFNDLREWKVDWRNNELPSLNYLDATGNEQWLPSDEILQLNNLKEVRGVTWNKYCQDCLLVKINITDDDLKRWFTYPGQIQYGEASKFTKVGFWPTCLFASPCRTYHYWIHRYQTECDVAIKSSFFLYATGSVALLANMMVVLFIVFHNSLRGDLPVCLVLNIAVCDALIGVVSVLYARFNFCTVLIDYLYDQMEGNDYDFSGKMKRISNIMGPILTFAVMAQVFGSFILTLEKFLKIVFAMKPDIRIRKRGAILFLFLSWSVSLTSAVLPIFEIEMEYNDGNPIPRGHKALGIVLLVIQLTSFVLYLPIFMVAKRSGANVGIKREATLARKIVLLAVTNLIFFTAPLTFGLYGEKSEIKDQTLDHEDQWTRFAQIVFPALCVCFNSILNPFLYALRHPKIKQQLQPIVSRCRTVLSACLVGLRQRLCCHLNDVQPESDMEMQDTQSV